MAILTFAAPVSGLRGKLGGNIFSANKGGPYVKAWGRGSNPRTNIQSAHRGKLVEFAQSWAAISAANKTNWDTFAALAAQDKTNSLGETYSISGFNWFIAININRAEVGSAQLDTAPTVAIPGTPIISNERLAQSSGASNSFVFMDTSSPDLTDNHAVYCTIKNSLGATVASEVRTHITTETLSGARSILFQSEIEGKFGDIIENQTAFYEVAIQNSDGRQGPRAAVSIVSTP